MWMPRSCSQVCMVAASTPYPAGRGRWATGAARSAGCGDLLFE
jgi:hypothetical protein